MVLGQVFFFFFSFFPPNSALSPLPLTLSLSKTASGSRGFCGGEECVGRDRRWFLHLSDLPYIHRTHESIRRCVHTGTTPPASCVLLGGRGLLFLISSLCPPRITQPQKTSLFFGAKKNPFVCVEKESVLFPQQHLTLSSLCGVCCVCVPCTGGSRGYWSRLQRGGEAGQEGQRQGGGHLRRRRLQAPRFSRDGEGWASHAGKRPGPSFLFIFAHTFYHALFHRVFHVSPPLSDGVYRV